MTLAPAQTDDRAYFCCTGEELLSLPPPDHKTDLQTGEFLVEYQRTTINRVALRLCGARI